MSQEDLLRLGANSSTPLAHQSNTSLKSLAEDVKVCEDETVSEQLKKEDVSTPHHHAQEPDKDQTRSRSKRHSRKDGRSLKRNKNSFQNREQLQQIPHKMRPSQSLARNQFSHQKNQEDALSFGIEDDYHLDMNEEEEEMLYDKNLRRGDTNYKLFSLRENSVIDFHKFINLEGDELGKP